MTEKLVTSQKGTLLSLPPSHILVPHSISEIALLTQNHNLLTPTSERPANQAAMARQKLDQQMATLEAETSAPLFDRSDYAAVRAFFDEAARDYDSDLENPYFAFSHEILKFILTTFINRHFAAHKTIKMFDAGAGTGNWSKFVLGLNEGIQGTLFDMNPHMLEVARKKLGDLSGKFVKIIEGNLENPSDYPPEKSNLILCMHNVIGMGRNIPLILNNLYDHLEVGGLAFIMTSNKYQAFDFTRGYRSDEEALRVIKDSTVKYKANMPEMFCFTPQEFEAALQAAHFDQVTVLGFPVTIKPEHADTQLLHKNITQPQLQDAHARAKLLALEKQLCLNPDLAYRAGSSLIAVCQKTANPDAA